jgi:hypothetical protein
VFGEFSSKYAKSARAAPWLAEPPITTATAGTAPAPIAAPRHWSPRPRRPCSAGPGVPGCRTAAPQVALAIALLVNAGQVPRPDVPSIGFEFHDGAWRAFRSLSA